MVVWTIWNRQNAVKFGHPTFSMDHIVPRAGALLQEFLAAQDRLTEVPIVAISHQWHPPEFPYYKANFDAAIFRQSSSTRTGVIIRDNKGEAIGALSMPIPLSNSVAILEALACRRALLFAKEIGLRQVVFEGASAMVFQAITHGNSELAEYGHIIEDIRILAADFDFIQFSHVKRNCNVVADALAKKAKDSLSLAVWLEEVPEDIAPFLLFDIS